MSLNTQLVGELELEPRAAWIQSPYSFQNALLPPSTPKKEKGSFSPFNTAICDVKNAVPRPGPHPWSDTLRILFLHQPSPKTSIFLQNIIPQGPEAAAREQILRFMQSWWNNQKKKGWAVTKTRTFQGVRLYFHSLERQSMPNTIRKILLSLILRHYFHNVTKN